MRLSDAKRNSLYVSVQDRVARVNWQWLPTWVGTNPELVKRIEEHLAREFLCEPATDETLLLMDNAVRNFLRAEFPGVFCG